MPDFYISWEIEGERQLSRKLLAISGEIKDLTTPLGRSAKMLVGVFSRDVFQSEGQAIKAKWARLSPYTVAQKARLGYGGKGILERTGNLKRSFRSVVSSTQAVVGNDAEYFKYHQSNKPRSRLPRRVMMKLADNQKEQIVKYFQEYIMSLG